jgi:hypothetical protein
MGVPYRALSLTELATFLILRTPDGSDATSSSSNLTTPNWQVAIPDTEHEDFDAPTDNRKRKRTLQKKIELIGFKQFAEDSMRKCYYMCNPAGEDGILKCVPTWSTNSRCKRNCIEEVLERYPDFKSIVVASNFGGAKRKRDQSALQYFVDEYHLPALRAMNNCRANFTRAIKRNFFQPNMDTNKVRDEGGPNPHCLLWGDFQLAKGCLKNEPLTQVRKPYLKQTPCYHF